MALRKRERNLRSGGNKGVTVADSGADVRATRYCVHRWPPSEGSGSRERVAAFVAGAGRPGEGVLDCGGDAVAFLVLGQSRRCQRSWRRRRRRERREPRLLHAGEQRRELAMIGSLLLILHEVVLEIGLVGGLCLVVQDLRPQEDHESVFLVLLRVLKASPMIGMEPSSGTFASVFVFFAGSVRPAR